MYFQYTGDRGEACWSSAVPASRYAHPEFGLLCPTPRFRRRLHLALAGLVVGALGLGVMAARDGSKPDTAATGTDVAFTAGTIPGTSPSPSSAALGSWAAAFEGAQPATDKPACVGDIRSDANCFSVKPRKPRMVRVATDRPAIAAVAIGRSSGTIMVDPALPGAVRPADMAKASDAEVATASAVGPEKPPATAKKAKKTAKRQYQRRDPYWYGAPSWREVEYQRGGYGRGGFTPNFW
jgi:hypothetical protein